VDLATSPEEEATSKGATGCDQKGATGRDILQRAHVNAAMSDRRYTLQWIPK